MTAPEEPRRRTPAEEARTIVEGTNVGTLATLTQAGDPWASLVTYGVLADGAPVLLVSHLAEHGRNLVLDPRASLVAATPARGDDPLDMGRVTLAGRAERRAGGEEQAARAAHIAAVPQAATYVDFSDFSLWVLRVERVRWVGGYGRMGDVEPADYVAAEADPVAAAAPYAVRHLNDDHADALLLMARVLAGHEDATAAACTGADRYGLDLRVDTPGGETPARVGFAERVTVTDGLREATVELARRARSG
jgi:hypothetical protein